MLGDAKSFNCGTCRGWSLLLGQCHKRVGCVDRFWNMQEYEFRHRQTFENNSICHNLPSRRKYLWDFDKVTVLYKKADCGFYWPVEEAKLLREYGLELPPRQSTAEFLTAITDPIGRYAKSGMENKLPRTAEEFEITGLKIKEYQKLQSQIRTI